MKPFTNPTSAAQLHLSGTLAALTDSHRLLLQLLGEANPLLKQQLAQVGGQFEQNLSQLGAAVEDAVLTGRGVRGHQRTLAGFTFSTDAAETVLPPKPEKPAEGKYVLNALYRALGMMVEENGQIAWMLPIKENYPRAVKKAITIEEAGQFSPADYGTGIYPVQEGEDLRGFVVVLRVDDNNIVVMSTQAAPSMVTFVEIEDEWYGHSQWSYLDATQFQSVLDKMTAGPVGSFTFDEKKWVNLFKALPSDAYEKVGAQAWPGQGFEIELDKHLKISFTGEEAYLTADRVPNGEIGDDEPRYARLVADEQFNYSYPFLNAKLKQLETAVLGQTPVKPEGAGKPAARAPRKTTRR